jgi:mannitol repressor
MKETVALSAALKGGAAFLRPGLSDIAVVILASSFLEKILRSSLVAAFRQNVVSNSMISSVFEGKGPLATLSAKIDVCIGLGYIADVREDLKIINRVRNDFAHSPVELYLKDYSVCRSLKTTAPIRIEGGECIERQKFKQACTGIIAHVCQATLITIAKDRFIAANPEGVIREYNAMISAAGGPEAPSE